MTKLRGGASALLDELDVPAGDERRRSSTSATSRRAIRRSRRTTIPIRHGSVVGIHNGIIENDDALLARYGIERAEPQMTVDSEAIFALMEHRRHDAARAVRDARRDGRGVARRARRRDALSRARAASTALARPHGRRPLLRVHAPRARDRRRGARRRASTSARCARDACSTSSRARSCASAASGPTAAIASPTTSRRFARRARPCPASSGSRRSPPQSARPSVPSGRDLDAVLAEPLAHEVLERGPGAARDVEQPVHLPLGQKRRIRAPRLRPVGHLRQSPERDGELGALRDRSLETLLALAAPRTRPRGARFRASRTCACTATRTGSSAAARRDRAPSAFARAPRRARGAAREARRG